jgi:hypothetical protein
MVSPRADVSEAPVERVRQGNMFRWAGQNMIQLRSDYDGLVVGTQEIYRT